VLVFNFCSASVFPQQKIRKLSSVGNKDLTFTAKAKDLILKAKDSKFVLEDPSRPRTKAKDNTEAQPLRR